MSFWTYVVGIGVPSAALIGGFAHLLYKEGKENMKEAFRKIGIDPDDVRFSVYTSNYINPKMSKLYPVAYHSNSQVKKTIETARANLPKEEYIETLFKMITPRERLSIIKKRKRSKYQNTHIFQETFHIEPSSLV